MKSFLSLRSLVFLTLFGICLGPQIVLAATASIRAENPTLAVGDTALVSVHFDTQGKRPNTIEGDINISVGADHISITEFTLAASSLRYWLKTPSLDSKSKISFVGGTPGGFNTKDGLLFKIVFTADSVGDVTITPENIKAYDNDGKATAITTTVQPLTLTIQPKTEQGTNHWLDIIAGDKEGPHDITVAVGQNEAVFNGQKFITISAVDDQSGIDHYEVSEGDRPAVRSGSTYVLLDQTEKSIITIAAYDKAGNVSKIQMKPTDQKPMTSTTWFMVVVIGLIVLYGIYMAAIFWRHRKKRPVGFR